MILRAAVVVLSTVLGMASAAAQPEPADPPEAIPTTRDTGFIGAPREPLEIDDCPSAPDVPPKQLEAMAAERYDRGEVLHLQGDYQGAVDELVHGYCLVPALAGRLLKDIAQSYERLVQYEKAVAYFERYLLVIASQSGTANEQRAIATRIQVLRQLRSTITVATDPRGSSIVVANEAGPVSSRRDGERLEVTAGTYTLVVEKPGYETIRQPLLVGIGQPYSYSFRLKPRSGTLRIQAVPGDARIIIDDRLAGIGSFAGELEIGRPRDRVRGPRLPRRPREGRDDRRRDQAGVEVAGAAAVVGQDPAHGGGNAGRHRDRGRRGGRLHRRLPSSAPSAASPASPSAPPAPTSSTTTSSWARARTSSPAA